MQMSLLSVQRQHVCIYLLDHADECVQDGCVGVAQKYIVSRHQKVCEEDYFRHVGIGDDNF